MLGKGEQINGGITQHMALVAKHILTRSGWGRLNYIFEGNGW